MANLFSKFAKNVAQTVVNSAKNQEAREATVGLASLGVATLIVAKILHEKTPNTPLNPNPDLMGYTDNELMPLVKDILRKRDESPNLNPNPDLSGWVVRENQRDSGNKERG